LSVSSPQRSQRLTAVLLLAALGMVGVALGWRWVGQGSPGLSDDRARIGCGAAIYAAQCASCHGRSLEGEPDWQSPRADGLMPAPPHNSDGHTWHHDSATLFGITKEGLVPPWAPTGYRSDMPAFGRVLSDKEIWAVLSFIASTWNEEARAWQRQIEAQAKAR
jgi:mono/diheme cytochrome c family protein